MVGFVPYWMGECWEDIPPELVTHICWFALELNAGGGIDAHHGWPDGPLVDYFHTGGVPVLITATLFNSGDLETLLVTQDYRINARNNLLDRMRDGDADGIMIDFEQLPSTMYLMMTVFMGELRSALDQAGDEDGRQYQLMVCTPAVDWAGSYDYDGLSDCCDALFIMGYNYYWSGSTTTGPIAAASGWGTYNVNWSVADHLNYNGSRPEQLLLGMPWYSYDWPTVSDFPGASTTASGTARTYSVARNLALEQGWQRETIAQTPWTPYQNNGWRQCWHEDTVSLGEKYDLIETYDLQGCGIWALGYQDQWTDVWSQIEERFGGNTLPGITDLSIEFSENVVRLSWTPLPDAIAYMIHASDNPHFTPTGNTLVTTQANSWFEEQPGNSNRFFRVVGVFE
jgi:spore germination protein YaaH